MVLFFRKFTVLLLTVTLLIFCFSGSVSADGSALSVSAKAAILIEAESGDVIFEKNADRRLPQASTTKIMTGIIAIERLEMSQTVTITEKSVGIEGSSIYLCAGEKLTVGELIYALLLESANDAAVALAIEISGSVSAFADLMNEKAEELGLSETHFMNPSGLGADGHYTSARDLAALTAYALKNPVFREIVSTKRYVIPLCGDTGSRVLLNHNKLLRLYDGAIGVKTGYTKESGRCLVSAAERDGVTLIAVTLNAPDDWNDHIVLLDHGFALYERVTLAPADSLRFVCPAVSSTETSVTAYFPDEVSVTVRKGTQIERTVELRRFYYGGIPAGDTVGRVVWKNGGKEIASVPLRSLYDVRKITYPSLWQRILSFFRINSV